MDYVRPLIRAIKVSYPFLYLNTLYYLIKKCNNIAVSDTKIIQAILEKVNSIDERVNSIDNRVDSTEKKMDRGFDEVKVMISENGERIDKIGLQLAKLEDDAPTIEDHEELEGRLEKLERQATIS